LESNLAVAEGNQHSIFFIQHDVEQAAKGQAFLDAVDVVFVPVPAVLLLVVKRFMAGLDNIRSHISVEVVDVVVLDAVGEGPQHCRDVKESAALQGCLRELPILLMLPVGQIHRVLQMEQDSSKRLSNVQAEVRFPSRQPQQLENPHIQNHTQELLED